MHDLHVRIEADARVGGIVALVHRALASGYDGVKHSPVLVEFVESVRPVGAARMLALVLPSTRMHCQMSARICHVVRDV